jgi:hypothetical protein
MKSPISLSAEVRWFFNGAIPTIVKKWFKSSPLRSNPEKRTDTYLIFPKAKSCGVKFRNSKFEIKSLVEDRGNRNFAAKARGAIRIWEKWSTKGESIVQLKQEATLNKAIWVDVKKKRIIRKFSADSSQIREVDASDKKGFPDNGCNVELTRVKIHQNPYWSLAFGAFGKEDTLIDNLSKTVRILLSEKECPFTSLCESSEISLSEEKCHSYPSFLMLHRNANKG